MGRTQKNKATEQHLGLLKAKLAKLKSQLIDDAKKGQGGPTGEGFDVAKTGDCRVSMIGFPSVGKSTLMNKITDVESECAAQEFTTVTCIPGEQEQNGTTIQVLDLPGIIEGAKDGKGRGKQVIGVARTCNLILLVLDALKPLTDKNKIENELEGFGIRLNKQPPSLTVKRKPKGGIGIMRGSQDNPALPDDLIKNILAEQKWHNCDVMLRQDGLTVDELIDVIEGNRKQIPCLQVLNKCDGLCLEELDLLGKTKNVCPISAQLEWNLDGLKEMIWDRLDLIRVQTKPRGEMPDQSKPVVIKRKNPTITTFCNKIHKHILENMKFAQVWGSSVKHNPQKCGKDHELQDEDIVQIVKK